MNLPIFPLNSCLFPGGNLSLMIFEIRYLKMIRKVNEEKSCFGIILLKEGSETNKPGASEKFYDFGTLARIVKLEVLQPTLFSVKVKGEDRFKIKSASKGRYSLWSASVAKVRNDDMVQIPKDVYHISQKLKDFCYLSSSYGSLSESEIIDSEERFEDSGWVANRWAELLPIESMQQQNLLEEIDPLKRLKKVDLILRGMKGA